MSIEVKVPALPESVADATVAQWLKKPGDEVKRDETLLELETDKVMLEVPAAQDGVLEKILKPVGSTVTAHETLALIASGAGRAVPFAVEKTPAVKPATETQPVKVQEKPATSALSPAVRRLVGEHEVDVAQLKGTGKDGRVTKEDVLAQVKSATTATSGVSLPEISTAIGERPEKRVPMSRLRARIAERLVEAQHNAAMLTTFNEVNMQPIMDLRARYKDVFEKSQGVKLGLMSFFVKAAVEALKRFPVVNASIDGDDIVYHGYYDIGIAVSTTRGLVVPILRDADSLSMGDIEKTIASYAEKARDGKLTLEEMTGGTFTITNGGIFGSMLSTPIINAPQCAILGMHNIVKRPIVENDQIVIRPIMYVAMSYDHRLIDGRESVSFLLTIKQLLEDPSRLVLGV
ncbi:MAG TPA: 2-oxoglutarate dehydrogenase complex dihydrolipoyllysine-residue succinyltransferase [Gammaproteobacteria bacterium]|nr:2-oxoglutarate dehydrogenase complex dihydrolipoyllysine-residue succinyltransferase [Gammaproteobacteria bacterium]